MKSDDKQNNLEFDAPWRMGTENPFKHWVTFDYSNPLHRSQMFRSAVQMHERIEFDHQPCLRTTMEYIQSYLAYFENTAFDSRMETEDDDPHQGEFKVAVELNHKLVYQGDMDQVPAGLLDEQLPKAECFAIEIWVDATLPFFHDNPDENAKRYAIDEDDTWQGRGMSDHLEGLKRKEQFTYKAAFRFPNDGSYTEFAYICNGKSYAVEDLCRTDIVQKAEGCNFYGEMITLHATFDIDAHPEILQQLRDAARDYVPDTYKEFMEETWEENDEDGDLHYRGFIIPGCGIEDEDLSKSQQFADRVNQILAPIVNECTIDSPVPALDHCFYNLDKFAVAAFVWKDQKLQIVGTIL